MRLLLTLSAKKMKVAQLEKLSLTTGLPRYHSVCLIQIQL